MALKNWTAEELRQFANLLQESADRVYGVVEKMELTSLPHIVLQADTAISIHAPSIANLTNLMDTEFTDQYNAAKYNRASRWEMNQKKVEKKYKKKGVKPIGHDAVPPRLSLPAKTPAKKASKRRG
jgi:hypothetical protein